MNIAVIDLETTGIDPATARIVEVAVVSHDSGTLFHSYVNPGIPVPPEATAIHGYTDADLAKRPKFPEIAPALIKVLTGKTIAGYNALAYDVPLLNAELKRYGFPTYGGQVLDGLLMWQQLEPRNLASARQRFLNKSLDGAHTALADAVATAEVIQALITHFEIAPIPAEELASRFQPPSRIKDGRITFGKHQGKSLKDIPSDYRRWMLTQDFDPATKTDIQASLA